MYANKNLVLPESKPGERASHQSGYSLLELVLVVAIVMVLMAIVVPGWTQPAKAANEVAAISYMRTWSTAQELYFSRHGQYASSSEQLAAEGLIPGDSTAPGYNFRLDNPPGSKSRWWGSGMPADPHVTGDRYFFISSDGVLRFSKDGPADSSSPALSSSPTMAVIEDEVEE